MFLARNDRLLSRRTTSAVILRDVDGRGATLKGTATTIWDLLDEPASREELIAGLRARYADPDGMLEDDVGRALDTLVADGILRELDDDG